jgi:hypothetical protein
MKLASGDFTVWLIIALIVGAGKLWNWFVAQHSGNSAEEAPPVVRPKPRPQPVRPVIQQMEQPKDLREFVDRFTQPPKPVAPPPVPKAVPPPKPTPPPPPVKPAPAPARQASRWVEALRDQQNLRNIIISAEIIGPPRGA